MEYSKIQEWLKRRRVVVCREHRKGFSSDPVFQKLLDRRIELGLTQRELAAKVGVHGNTICYSEMGKGTTSFLNVVAWANALGFTLELRDQVNE